MQVEQGDYYTARGPRLLEQDLKKQWTASLRSDKYKDRQGKNMLKTPEGNFCCLGVVCDMFDIRETKDVRDVNIYNGEAMSPTLLKAVEVSVFGHSGDMGSHTLLPIDFTPFHIEYDFGTKRPWRGSGTILSAVSQNEFGGEEEWIDYSLPVLNDMGFTFAQIADLIDYFL